MDFPKKVSLSEVGLRDGLQNEKRILDVQQKVDLFQDIVASGFKIIEVGSFVRPDRVPSMANSAEVFQYFQKHPVAKDMELRALIPNEKGLDRAIECGCPCIKIGVSASAVHNMKNYNRTPEESIGAFEKVFEKAKENNVEVIGTVQMAFGSPWDGDIPNETIFRIVDRYQKNEIRRVGLGDTSSMANPKKVYRLISDLRERYPEIHFKAHFHDARGLGLSNVVAGLMCGLEEFDSAFAGLGGCPFVPNAAGNIATEDLVNMMNELGIETGVDIERCIQTGLRVEELVGHQGHSAVLRAGTCEQLIRRIRVIV